jgi:hypothetical protein
MPGSSRWLILDVGQDDVSLRDGGTSRVYYLRLLRVTIIFHDSLGAKFLTTI